MDNQVFVSADVLGKTFERGDKAKVRQLRRIQIGANSPKIVRRVLPTLGEVDLYLIGEGRHENLWRVLGAHVREFPGLKQDMVALSPFGRAVTPELRTKILAMKQGFVDDSLKLYKGPLKDNEGNVILKEGEVIANDDNKFKLAVNFLVEGAVGKTGLKK